MTEDLDESIKEIEAQLNNMEEHGENNGNWNGFDYMLAWIGVGLCSFLISMGIGYCCKLTDYPPKIEKVEEKQTR